MAQTFFADDVIQSKMLLAGVGGGSWGWGGGLEGRGGGGEGGGSCKGSLVVGMVGLRDSLRVPLRVPLRVAIRIYESTRVLSGLGV